MISNRINIQYIGLKFGKFNIEVVFTLQTEFVKEVLDLL